MDYRRRSFAAPLLLIIGSVAASHLIENVSAQTEEIVQVSPGKYAHPAFATSMGPCLAKGVLSAF